MTLTNIVFNGIEPKRVNRINRIVVNAGVQNICGALDRCTPAEEAMQFHAALLENGVKSMLVTYPEEGHGVRKWPAAIDYSARLVGWIEEHLQ